MEARMIFIGVFRRVDIAAIIDDRRAFQAHAAIGDLAAFIGAADGYGIGLTARRAVIAVIVEPADGAVEIEELLWRNGARLQGSKTVLHADIVPASPRGSCLLIPTENV